ncbi:MAG: class I SAM-dependent methyltransferase [Candidatus Methanomethyliaceae archaeon]
MMTNNHLSSSFRDPSGFVFVQNGILYRQVNHFYAQDYERLMKTGLYDKLVNTGYLIPHTEVNLEPVTPDGYKILHPEHIPFISYPYEWCFGQFKEAALTTLYIQKHALKFDMSLKDANAYNIQFYKGKAIWIDTLSFETYKAGEPWVAYRQFCQHFLAPLALMATKDIRLGQLLRVYIDGIPLDLASRLLPLHTYWNPGLLLHIHYHARIQKKYAGVSFNEVRRGRMISREALLGLIESLERTIQHLNWKPADTQWSEYYQSTHYTKVAFTSKKRLVTEWVDRVRPRLIWDLGANIGVLTRQAVRNETYAIAWDIDPLAVEQNWKLVRQNKEQNILPLLVDLTNPSPAIGWNNRERDSFAQRGPADLVMALALIHHLAISNNLPLERIAESMAEWGKWLIIEFVPKSDEQVQKLLRNRVDIFTSYTRDGFETAFGKYFEIIERQPLQDSQRWLYLMRRVSTH